MHRPTLPAAVNTRVLPLHHAAMVHVHLEAVTPAVTFRMLQVIQRDVMLHARLNRHPLAVLHPKTATVLFTAFARTR